MIDYLEKGLSGITKLFENLHDKGWLVIACAIIVGFIVWLLVF